MLAQEFEHRLVNGMQLIVSLLSLQSRAATTPEATDQLMIAARRVSPEGQEGLRAFLDKRTPAFNTKDTKGTKEEEKNR